MRIATIELYDNEHICLPWEKADDLIVWSHEITEIEASKLIPSYCGFLFFGSVPQRCGSDCSWNHQIRVSEDRTWPLPHMLASVAFGCGIKLKDGWLTLNVDQCWCILKMRSIREPD
jgi:hypothetical protein